MSSTLVIAAIAAVLFATAGVNAETHTIRFNNQCGHGTPQLIQGGNVLSTGDDYTSNGVFSAGIAYLQTGNCGFNGEECTMVEMTLVNPTSPGSGSSTDITLIAPHAFNVQTSFSYFNGCNGSGANCASADCNTAFFQSDDNQVQVQCETNNVDLLISFCSDATQDVNNQGSGEPASSSAAAQPASTHVASPSPDPQPAPSSVAVHSSAKASPTLPAVAPSSSIAPVVNPAPSSAAPVLAASSAVISASAPASAASASATTPNRKTCKNANKKRRSASPEPEPAAKAQSRAIYDAHRRHHARAAVRRHDSPF
ncbi:hypothetical protein OBBRIDRAFT_831202 [Obba rivulosa]|uniref:Glycopeptide n=1 Tax=Obba rivulosa TaxID=1052685 RepID=A0A8E2DSP9_9APHY|nr:hypothetical protein OBBRIDRAFT_831202 [Obba rivulosa]